MSENNFRRIEKKFWMTPEQYQILMKYIQDVIELDQHGESDICNIYFDTKYYALIRRSIERPYFKEKLRLRSYGIPTENSEVFLELKRKYNGIGYKRRALLTYRRAFELLSQAAEPQNQIEAEIQQFTMTYPIEPKVLLTYHRRPCYLKSDPEFRITFDTELRYKPWHTDIVLNNDGDYIMDNPSCILMELKTSKAMPYWFSELLNYLEIYQAPYSKIGACYINHLKEDNIYAE